MLGFKIHDENAETSLVPKKSGKRLGKSNNNVHFSEPFISEDDSINKTSVNKIKVVKSGRKALSSLSGSQVNTRLAAGSTSSTVKKTHDFTKDSTSFSISQASTNFLSAQHLKVEDRSSHFASSSSLPSTITISNICEPSLDSNDNFSIPAGDFICSNTTVHKDLFDVTMSKSRQIRHRMTPLVSSGPVETASELADEILSSIPNHLEGYEVDEPEDLFPTSRCGVYRELEEKLGAEILMDDF